MSALKSLHKNNLVALIELVQKCRNPEHKMSGNTLEVVTKMGLINNGSIHDIRRNIILSAVSGDGRDMRFVNPVKVEEDKQEPSRVGPRAKL